MGRSDLSRMRIFYVFGIVTATITLFASTHLGGDPALQRVFWMGLFVIIICFIASFIFVSRIELYRPRPVAILWLVASTAFLSGVAYVGPFSMVLMVNVLGLMFISLGEFRRTAFATAAIQIAGHFLIALPLLMGWSPDRSLSAGTSFTREQLWFSEFFALGLLGAGILLARWARTTQARALDELERAMRVIGEKDQLIVEVVDDARRTNWVGEGRWSHSTMGSFTLGVVLGRGSMGEVYEAVHRDGTPAAVKLLNARSVDRASVIERFHREMSIAAQLESPHIVRVYELSSSDAPVPYIAMERLHGTDLASRLRLEGRIASDEVSLMLDHVARGLEVARLAGVVHRDLKPHNLFFHARTTWKILDFGVSKLMGSEGTLTGDEIVGTPQYMAPEQAAGAEVSHRTDVYALAAVAYRCLTGRSLFQGRDLAELVYQVVHRPPARPSSLVRVSPAVEHVLALGLAKDPRRRFPSALTFAQAFVAARRGVPAPIEPPPNAWC